MTFMATKKEGQQPFFLHLLFLVVGGSGIRDLGSKKIRIRNPRSGINIWDQGSGINIPDPQH
jgi:hypothetical protein